MRNVRPTRIATERLWELETANMGKQELVRHASLDRCLAPIQLAGGGRMFGRHWLRGGP